MSNEEIAKSVIKKLSKLNKNLSVAESITGGGLATALTDIAGSSKVFVGGVIAYSDEVKINQYHNEFNFGELDKETAMYYRNTLLSELNQQQKLKDMQITSLTTGLNTTMMALEEEI